MITMSAIARWCDHVFRLTVGPSLSVADRHSFGAKPTVDCDAREVIRRALLIGNLGHLYIESDEWNQKMVAFARAAAVELEVTDGNP